MKITTRIKGDAEFRRKMKIIYDRFRKPTGLYKSWGIQTLKWVTQNYKTSGGNLKDGKWKPLAPLTILQRRKKSSVPLLNTGHMMRQWNYKVIAGGVVVGNPMDIAQYHEAGTMPYIIRPKNKKALYFGAPHGKKKGGIFAKIVHHPGLPQRRQLPEEVEIMPEILKVTDKWVERAIK